MFVLEEAHRFSECFLVADPVPETSSAPVSRWLLSETHQQLLST